MRGVEHLLLQPGQCHERLDRRSRRIGALQRAVVQRSLAILQQRRVGLAADARHERLRIEAGLGHQRDDLAVARIDRHHRAVEFAQRFFRHRLHPGVQGQHQIQSRRTLVVLQFAQRPAIGIGLDDLGARGAAQFVFVRLFHADLADL